MTQRLITFGYGGRKPEEIKVLVEESGGMLIDIRFVAASRHPQWGKAAFARLLGERYVHCAALGNMRYRQGPPIQIADLGAGGRFLEALPGPVAYLMCACKDAATCHRTTVAEALRPLGFTVEEIGAAPNSARQGRLL